MALLSIEDLSFTYPNDSEPSLKKINLTVKAGDLVVIAGASASGKTTLLRLLKPELSPTGLVTGEVLYRKQRLKELSLAESGAKIGFVMQDPSGQIVSQKVWSELAFGLENLGLAQKEIRSRVAEMAHYFGMESWFNQDTQALSSGQKQLLNLASVVIMRPEILILDEPTAYLDPVTASEFIQTVIQLNEEFNMTIIIAEHRLEEILPVANQLLVLSEGEQLLKQAPELIDHQSLKKIAEENILANFPVSVQTFSTLASQGQVPLTLKAGRKFLASQFTGQGKLKVSPQIKNNGPAIVKLSEVSFRYERNSQDVLANLDLTLQKGEIFALIGGNGAGKSTLLKVLSGGLSPYSGKIKLFNQKLKKAQVKNKHLAIGYLPQEPRSLFLGLTLEKDLSEFAKLAGFNQVEFAARLAELSQILPLKSILTKEIDNLSGGQLQQAALAKVLFLEPELLLLDEPTKGLDSGAKTGLKKLLKLLSQDGKTILVVSHDLDFIGTVATRCGLFFNGEIISTNEPREFFPQHYFYTTNANRLGRQLYPQVITTGELVEACLSERGQEHDVSV